MCRTCREYLRDGVGKSEAGVKVTGSHDPSDDDSSHEPCGRLMPIVHLSIHSSQSSPPHSPHLLTVLTSSPPHSPHLLTVITSSQSSPPHSPHSPHLLTPTPYRCQIILTQSRLVIILKLYR
ncbi:hypothetical protein Pmani_006105 [Petrolisthes manimaculis]|uniref:Uncharacterized protein n=1 Tax=Petrolisthes manimaculis TaxID=1843537 RepID=A0AAE1QBB7_9EUCA|nr:hypothetical protein Pmani_006105 [Petrolisthes manimaculis]